MEQQQAQVTSTGSGVGNVTLTEADIAPLIVEKAEPTLEEVKAAAAARAGEYFEVTPLTNEELAQAGDMTPKDWAESLTHIAKATRELEDAIPTRKRAATQAAMAKLQANVAQLQTFLRIRGLSV